MKVLITDNCHEDLLIGLSSHGNEVVYLPHLSLNEIDAIIEAYDGIIINTRVKMDKARIDLGHCLSFIGRMGSGLDIIDLPYAALKGIKVISSPEGNAQAVAEHSLAMLLTLLNKLPLGASQVKNFEWDREGARGRELSGKTIGIIGYGHTGPALAQVLSGFRVNIKVYDKYKEISDSVNCAATIVQSTFEDIIAHCDVISFNIPLTDETALLIDESLLRRIKPGAILINASRGGIVKLDDVWNAIEDGRLGGCCLDVFPNVKPQTYNSKKAEVINKMAEHPAVILTPHVAGWTIESKQKIAQILVDKIVSNI